MDFMLCNFGCKQLKKNWQVHWIFLCRNESEMRQRWQKNTAGQECSASHLGLHSVFCCSCKWKDLVLSAVLSCSWSVTLTYYLPVFLSEECLSDKRSGGPACKRKTPMCYCYCIILCLGNMWLNKSQAPGGHGSWKFGRINLPFPSFWNQSSTSTLLLNGCPSPTAGL